MCSVTGQVHLPFRPKKKTVVSNTLANRTIQNNLPFRANHNCWIGMNAYVITNKQPQYYQPMVFGLTTSWATKKMYLFNARAEGKLNLSNDVNYKGELGIFQMPSFKESIQQRRCIIPVDYFIEGSEQAKLNDPFLIRKKDKQAILLAGIWDEWLDKQTGSIFNSYSIITTAAAALLSSISHHRTPLILTEDQLEIWMSDTNNQTELTNCMAISNLEDYEILPISTSFKSKSNNAESIQARNLLF